MSVFKLADEHPLTKAGLRCLHLVETAERGLRIGDVVFEFPFGRIVDTGMACRREGIIPPGIDLVLYRMPPPDFLQDSMRCDFCVEH